MIVACASRFERDCRPLVWGGTGATAGVVLLDGVASWGSGAEAAAWTRDQLARMFQQVPPTSPDEISRALARAIAETPTSISTDEWGWSFSAAAVLVTGGGLHAATMGRHAIVTVGACGTKLLATPARLIDNLVASGHVEAADAERHELSGVLKGPFLGETHVELAWEPPVQVAAEDHVVVGDAALPRLLEFRRLGLLEDPIKLRDAVEECGGPSSSTAIIACRKLAGRLLSNRDDG